MTMLLDGLANVLTGSGTTADKRTHGFYHYAPLGWQQIDAMYRSSWSARKIVDKPASEMCREKRNWQADDADITSLETLERDSKLWAKLEEAVRLSRLGGAVMVLGVKQGLPDQPLRPEALGPGCLQYLHVMSRQEITIGEIDRDPASDNFGCPLYYEIMGNSAMVRIHPSRVIPFRGEYVPSVYTNGEDAFWGASILETARDAIRNFDAATNGFASIVEDASIDVFGIPDLLQSVGTAEYEGRLMRRLTLAATGKSTHRALIRDANETWEQHQASWAGMPDIIASYAGLAAACGDMPATVFLGKSPDGMNATGEGDMQNWYRTVDGWRERDLRPALDRLDPIMRAHAGIADGDVWWEFGSLYEESDTVKAATIKTVADAAKVAYDMGVPAEPLGNALAAAMVESGLYPGLDAGMAQIAAELAELPSAAEAAEQAAEEARLTAEALGGTGGEDNTEVE